MLLNFFFNIEGLCSLLILRNFLSSYDTSDTLISSILAEYYRYLSDRRILHKEASPSLTNSVSKLKNVVIKRNITIMQLLIFYLDTVNIEWTVLNHTHFSRWAGPNPYTIETFTFMAWLSWKLTYMKYILKQNKSYIY